MKIEFFGDHYLSHDDFFLMYVMSVKYHHVLSRNKHQTHQIIFIIKMNSPTFTFSICSSAKLNAFCNSAFKDKNDIKINSLIHLLPNLLLLPFSKSWIRSLACKKKDILSKYLRGTTNNLQRLIVLLIQILL